MEKDGWRVPSCTTGFWGLKMQYFAGNYGNPCHQLVRHVIVTNVQLSNYVIWKWKDLRGLCHRANKRNDNDVKHAYLDPEYSDELVLGDRQVRCLYDILVESNLSQFGEKVP
jgi:hypothetical protein